jgi:hypothetical protein
MYDSQSDDDILIDDQRENICIDLTGEDDHNHRNKGIVIKLNIYSLLYSYR